MDNIYKDKALCTVTPLFATDTQPAKVTKVGVLPFMRTDRHTQGWQVLMMKPRAKKAHQTEALFQLPKGTRRIFLPEGERDMSQDDLERFSPEQYEPLLSTALREGAEEVGLKQENILRLWDAGVHHFNSASTGKQKPLHMFAAEIKDRAWFDAYEASTSEIRWVQAHELADLCRADHVHIIEVIMKKLLLA